MGEELQDRNRHDINELKIQYDQLNNDQSKMKEDIQNLKISDKLQDKEIESLRNTLVEIKSDTQWIRRRITGAIITTVITAVVGGIIAVIINNVL